MRKIERIAPFMEELTKIWEEEFQDWRFGQLIVNFVSWYGADPFYLEEDKMLDLLKDFVKSIKGN